MWRDMQVLWRRLSYTLAQWSILFFGVEKGKLKVVVASSEGWPVLHIYYCGQILGDP
jgi:hypothetical protein